MNENTQPTLTSPDGRIHFRSIQASDFWPLFGWRHDTDTERWSYTPAPTYKDHHIWMHEHVNRDHYYVGTIAEQPCCIVSVTYRHCVGITVDPGMRRLGIATQCIEFMQTRYSRLHAWIVIGNIASIRLFTNCGFDLYAADVHNHRPSVLMKWARQTLTRGSQDE